MAGTAGQAGNLGTQSMVQMPGLMADFGTVPASVGHGASPAEPGAQKSQASKGRQAAQATKASQPRKASQARKASQPRPAKRTSNAGQNGSNQGQPAGTAAIPGLEAPMATTPRHSSSPAAPSYTRNALPAESTHVPG